MDALLSRLERTFLGKLAIERLTTFLVGGMALVYVLGMLKPPFLGFLHLDPRLVTTQPWRLVTYLFLPPASSPIWVLFALYFTWLIGSNLESAWGPLKFNVYYLLGALGTTAAALITGEPQTNVWLNMTLYFAFATLFPDYQILLFFILPVRIKWLALLGGALIVYRFVDGGIGEKAAIGTAFANYLLFFGAHLASLARGRRVEVRQRARRDAQSAAATAAVEKKNARACALCGVRQDDGADIRVCSCEKCGGPRDLCLEHARNH
jgi:membrane associated rhomboid family serine protease